MLSLCNQAVILITIYRASDTGEEKPPGLMKPFNLILCHMIITFIMMT